MSKVKIEIAFEDLKKVVSQLSDDEKEELFFILNPAWGKALEKMEKETIREDEKI